MLAFVWPFGLAYALSYALRTINAVLAPEFERALNLSAADLGLLASAYFFSFALMQIPLGLALDRKNPVRIERRLLLVAVLGCMMSAVSTDFWTLWLGRACIGIGVSACLMSAYKAFRLEFEPRMQAPLASIMLVLGSLGALSATLPVSLLLAWVSWQGIFWLLCGCFAIAWLALGRLERHFERVGLGVSTPPAAWEGLIEVLRHPAFLRLLPFGVLSYGGFLALHGLWLGPWLMDVEGATQSQAAEQLFWLTGVIMIGHMSWATLTQKLVGPRMSLDLLMRLGLWLFAGLSGLATFSIWPHPIIGWGLAFLAAGATTLSYSVVALSFRVELSARATTAFNFLVFVGAFLVQWGMGIVVDLVQFAGFSKIHGLQSAVGLWVGTQVIALVWMQRAYVTRPSSI
ncbi:MAG: transporter, family, proline/betaine transporter [Pseudomonadota bacterium]